MPKLIVALDFDNQAEALNLVEQLNPAQCALKVGSEMFTRLGTDFVRKLVDTQFNVFLDLKFHDIPNTVARACKAAADLGVWMLNVHACGGLSMMNAARESLASLNAGRPLLIGVTVLTSMSQDELETSGIHEPLEKRVATLARLTQEAGLDGVVCSALEVPTIKSLCGPSFLTVTPGIRLASDSQDDQARIVTPVDAIKAGSDFLVIGRPITKALDPTRIVHDILSSI
jgi:orotidine-5'-phosphate decarboxylase